MLYLKAQDHEAAMLISPQDPGRLYDDARPGYQLGMLRAFEQVLEPPDRRFERLSAATYKGLHELVTAGLTDKPSWNGEPDSGPDPDPVHFGVPVDRLAEDMLTEYVAGRPLVAALSCPPGPPAHGAPESPHRDQREADALTGLRRGELGARMMVVSGYRQNEAPGLADAALDVFYTEIGGAADDIARLTAIARLIRRLQVMHLFTDANGRLNVRLLLPRLLLENGFRPVIHPDLVTMFSGIRSLEEIVSVLRAGQPGAGPAAENPSGRILPPPDPRIEVARQVIAALPGLGWSGEVPDETRILDLFTALTRQGTYMGRTVRNIADYIARMIIRDWKRQGT